MSQKITTPGIYVDFPEADYHADPCPAPSLNQSLAKILIEQSPAHARLAHPRLAPPATDEAETAEKYDSAKAIGNAAHRYLIGRGKEIAVGKFPSWQTKEAKAFRAEAEATGKTVILDKHDILANRLVSSVRERLTEIGWTDVFNDGHGEVAVAWQEDGFWFRTLIDWLPGTLAPFDLKTTGLSVAPHAIPNLMVTGGWEVQAAFHERALDAVDPDGRGRRKFRFGAVENEPPFAFTPVELTEAALTMGRKKLDYAVALWKACLAADEWPAYPAEVCRPEYPGWHESRWLEREVAEADRASRSAFARKTISSLMGG